MDPATEDEPEAPGKPRLDRRTITICVAIAAAAAILSAILVVSLLDPSDDDTAGGGGSDTEATLTKATKAPDTALTRFDGSTVTLSDFRGQKLLVNFFASSCIPCKKEMPALQRVHQRLGDDVTFIGIAVQDDPEAAQELIDKTGVSYDLAQDRTGTLLRKIGGVGLPTTVFVGGDGTILERHTGELSEQEITQKISDNLLAGG
jgi:thiol-disulfide isomerase/thioredoxin